MSEISPQVGASGMELAATTARGLPFCQAREKFVQKYAEKKVDIRYVNLFCRKARERCIHKTVENSVEVVETLETLESGKSGRAGHTL
ncbi:MAG: hypothetical protein ACI4OU_05570 [Candidatus Enterenecus sp.]